MKKSRGRKKGKKGRERIEGRRQEEKVKKCSHTIHVKVYM